MYSNVSKVFRINRLCLDITTIIWQIGYRVGTKHKLQDFVNSKKIYIWFLGMYLFLRPNSLFAIIFFDILLHIKAIFVQKHSI